MGTSSFMHGFTQVTKRPLTGLPVKVKPALTAGFLSATPSVPQLQCQEADSCPTGGKDVYTGTDQVKKSKTVTEEQKQTAPAMSRGDLQRKSY